MDGHTASSSGPSTFSVVIATLRRVERLRKTLESVAACSPPPGEVIVVDGDGARSAATVVEALADRFPRLAYLVSGPGLPLQRNRGLSEASGDIVVFLDDDVLVDEGLFGALENAYRDPAVVGATTRVNEPLARRVGRQSSTLRRLLPGGGKDGSFTRFGYPRYLTDPSLGRDVEFMLGCMMSARREAAVRVRFDERLSGYALAEDEDFSYRLSQLGRVRYLPDIVTRHEKTGFSSHDSRLLGRMVVRNRRYLFRKNFPQTPLARLQFNLFIGGLLVHRVLNRDWPSARGIVEGMLERRRS